MNQLSAEGAIFSSKGGYTDWKQWSLNHAREVFLEAKEYDEVFDCIMVSMAKRRDELLCNPIYHFSESDVWRYIRENGIEVNPLYEKGYKRIGCIMCPLGGRASMLKEAADYPKYKAAYIRAFERMIKERLNKGMKTDWKTGEEVYDWWLRADNRNIDGQISFLTEDKS